MIKPKSILVDVDESTAKLMESISSDITSDVNGTVRPLLEGLKNQILQQIEDLKIELGGSVNSSNKFAENCLRSIKDLEDQIMDIEDSLSDIAGLDKISSVVPQLLTLTDSLKKHLDESVNTIDNSVKTLSVSIDNVEHSQALAALDLKSLTEQALKKQDESRIDIEKLINEKSLEVTIALDINQKKIDESTEAIAQATRSHIEDHFASVLSKVEQSIGNTHTELADLLNSGIQDVSTNMENGKKEVQEALVTGIESSKVNQNRSYLEIKEFLQENSSEFSKGIEHLLKESKKDFSELTNEIESLNSRMTSLEKKVAGISEYLKQIEDSFNTKTADFDNKINVLSVVIDNGVGKIMEGIHSFDERLNMIEEKIDKSTASLSSETANVSKLLTVSSEKLVNKVDDSVKKMDNHHAAVTSMLDKVLLFISTPFWKRKKLNDHEV